MEGDLYTVCYEWGVAYTKKEGMTYGITILLCIVNFVIKLVFTFLAKFEKHSLYSNMYSSKIFKIFIAIFVNQALILLIASLDFGMEDVNPTELAVLVSGTYSDISPDWFLKIGAIIIFNAIIQIFTVAGGLMAGAFVKCCLRCCDRGCTFNEAKTKKKMNEAWIDLYTGPEFLIDFRYSQILVIVFLCMLYSGGMPIMYFIAFIHLF